MVASYTGFLAMLDAFGKRSGQKRTRVLAPVSAAFYVDLHIQHDIDLCSFSRFGLDTFSLFDDS